MGIFKILLRVRRPSVRPRRPSPAGKSGTPMHGTRRQFLLHGESYTVALQTDTRRNSLTIREHTFHVALHPATRENFDRFMRDWYRRQARKSFQAAVDRWLPLFAAAGHELPRPRLKIFAMRRAWGRCYYTKGVVTLNLHLVKTPRECIDYIVLHELCHFVVNNHSSAFHRLVESFLPEWRTVDAQLKTFARERRVIA